MFRNRIIVNIDGLEHRRGKWGNPAKRFLRFSEKCTVLFADIVVADNQAIKDYVWDTYSKDAVLIAYGGDHALRDVSAEESGAVLEKYNLTASSYAITVCRIEPENNCHIILEAFSRSNIKFIFIGNWNRSKYGKSLKEKYSCYENIKILDPIYDLDELFVLRSNAGLYVHGHSAGGTNPSLVEAMHMAIPIAAYDVEYNKATTERYALYFKDCESLRNIIENRNSYVNVGMKMKEIAQKEYTWKDIINKYETLIR